MRVTVGLLTAALCATVAGCSGGSSPAPSPSVATPAPSPTPSFPPTATITYTATGVSPKDVEIALGGHVTFVNDDTRPHMVMSLPEALHTDCPAINQVNYLTPGQRKSTGAFEVVRTCGFHDHYNEYDPAFRGVITVR
jgi:plastocyanin